MRLQRECRKADFFGIDRVDAGGSFIDEPEQRPERLLPEFKRVERERIAWNSRRRGERMPGPRL
jgi:hypothetical protein